MIDVRRVELGERRQSKQDAYREPTVRGSFLPPSKDLWAYRIVFDYKDFGRLTQSLAFLTWSWASETLMHIVITVKL